MRGAGRRRHLAGPRSLGTTAVVVAALVTTGCTSDPTAVYRDSAVAVLEATLSEARTAELAGRLWVADRSPHAMAVVVVAESETGVGGEASWFEEQQPPNRASDPVRGRTVDALDGASSAVQAVRISLGRSDRPGTRAALDELRSACSDLESLAEELG
jgi:hypothetical protein